MSFDIHVNFHGGGEFVSLPVAILERIFGPYAEPENRRDPEWWNLTYSDRDHGVLQLHPDANNQIRSFGVNRPPGSPLFWEGILQVLREKPAVLYWPGDNPIVVASEAMIEELPKDMVEALGMPTVVSTIEEILEKIRTS
jgi:hypothetical protein